MTGYGEDHKNSPPIRGEILRKSKSFVIVITARSGSAQRE
jgi:hypothetical protein